MGKGLGIVNRMVMGGLSDDVLLGQSPEGGKEPTVRLSKGRELQAGKQQMKRPSTDNVPGMFKKYQKKKKKKKYHHISHFPFAVWYQHAGDPCSVNGNFAVTLQVHLGKNPNDSNAFHLRK